MSCFCCDEPDYDAMFKAYDRMKARGSILDKYWAKRFEEWVEEQIKPLPLFGTGRGHTVRWKYGD